MSDAKKHQGLCVGGPNDGKLLSSDMQRVIVPDLTVPGPGIGSGTYAWHNAKRVWIYSLTEVAQDKRDD